MQVNMNKVLVDMLDREIKGEEGVPITLRLVSMNALCLAFEDERNLGGEEKLKRWELALRIKNSSESVQVTAEELALIKKVVAKAYAPLVSGQAWKLLEETK